MSHGQSQEVTAATLLHKAMEYETLSPAEELSNLYANDPFFCDVHIGICKHCHWFAPFM